MKKYFWNEEQNRLRTLWRLSIQLTVWGGMLALVQIAVLLTHKQAITKEALWTPSVWTRLVTLLIAVYLMVRYVDKRHFSDYGLNLKDKEWWYDFGFGVFLGGLLIVGIFLAQYLSLLKKLTAEAQRAQRIRSSQRKISAFSASLR